MPTPQPFSVLHCHCVSMLVLSDIHANLPALEAVLDDAPQEPSLCCGDIVGYYPWPNDVIAHLQERAVTAVKGNHDNAILMDEVHGFRGLATQALAWQRSRLTDGSRSFLEALPTRVETRVAGQRVVMVHGSPSDPFQEYVYPDDVDAAFLERHGVDADIVLLGHTHVPFAKHVEGTLVANPGSVGQPRDGNPDAAYAVLSGKGVEHRRVAYPVEDVVDAVKEADLPRVLGERLRRGQ